MKSELAVVISCDSDDTTLASRHIFTCHNVLWLFQNTHDTIFRVLAVCLTPQHVVVVFSAQWAFSIFERNIQGVLGGMCNTSGVFLMLNYTDITQNTYIQSWTVTEIMAREKCGHLAFPRSIRLQLYREPPLPVGHPTAWGAYVG